MPSLFLRGLDQADTAVHLARRPRGTLCGRAASPDRITSLLRVVTCSHCHHLHAHETTIIPEAEAIARLKAVC